jgi:hypothetical protein
MMLVRFLKKAVIIPLLKDGKDPRQRESYRPVSLTPVMVKVMEKMVVSRLNHWMEENEVVNPWQSGFRRGRSTEDQVIRLCQEVQDGFEDKPHSRTLAIALDCSKAYDRVWKTKLVRRMMDENVPTALVRWLKDFLEDRKACVRYGNVRSGWRRLQEGLPQGAVCSPILFLLYANDWEDHQVEGVQYSGFADDVALWVSSSSLEELRSKAQMALNKILEWAEDHKILLNPSKTEACLFTNNINERDWDPGLKIGDRAIAMKKKIRLLGVNVDQRLTFNEHLEAVCQKMRKRTNIIRVLTNREWG